VPAKYRFSAAERFAVWEAHDGQCFWCGEPLVLAEVTVDHVIPELYAAKPDELARIRSHYALGDAFALNDFSNWVPAHQRCNRSKGTTLFRASPAMVAILERVGRRAARARTTRDKVEADRDKGRILGRLITAVEGGVITRADVEALFAGLDPSPAPAPAAPPPFPLRVTPQWAVVRREYNLVHLSDGRRYGVTWGGGGTPDMSWLCPHCGSYGPWDGVICLNCMQRSDPND
jgi:hypothetical protein